MEMLTFRVLQVTPRHRCRLSRFVQPSSRRCSSAPEDQLRALLRVCVDRHYIHPGHTNTELFQHGLGCSYGPLGMELRRNLLDQWWHSVSTSSARVFGVKTLKVSKEPPADGGQLGIVDLDKVTRVLEQKDLSREELVQQVRELLQRSPFTRTSLYQGKVDLQGVLAELCSGRLEQRRFVSRCFGAVCPVTGAGEQKVALRTG